MSEVPLYLSRGGPTFPEEGQSVQEAGLSRNSCSNEEIGTLLPNNQRQHRTLHIQKDVLPFALC